MTMAFQDSLATARSVYELPQDDLIGEVLVPALGLADEVRISAGFFTSSSFGQIAPGLVQLLTQSDRPLQLLISPAINAEDQDAMRRAIKTPEAVLAATTEELFEEAHLSQSKIVQHTASCLAYLLAAGRLQIRFVLMPEGQYHKKIWLIHSDSDWLAVHGSGNATFRGLFVNGEQMTIDRSWCDGDRAADRVDLLLQQWDRSWNNQNPGLLTVGADGALRVLESIAASASSQIPTVQDFLDAWQIDYATGLEPIEPPSHARAVSPKALCIPGGLDWNHGNYAHQGGAVASFLSHNQRGIITVATGGGKTKIALICATKVQDSHAGSLLVVILVPTRPLIVQWATEVRAFGVEPHVLSDEAPAKRNSTLTRVAAALMGDAKRTEVLVVSNKLFSDDPGVRELVAGCGPDVKAMLIGDEVHNLGVPSFLNALPEGFDARLGLSATPTRQYDEAGSAQLTEYFAGDIFEFSLQQAIDSGCLVPYAYHLHEVHLTDSEMDLYQDLTTKLIQAGFGGEDRGQSNLSERIKLILFARRSILENAEEKLVVLRRLLSTSPRDVTKTLIYASAKKEPEGHEKQIVVVNRMLQDLGIVYHQYTSRETGGKNAQTILERFGDGHLQVLTAMKVLDEGVDIPQTDTAYILASSTVKREWVQRRGRILRSAPGKHSADIHDFFVIPPNPDDSIGRGIIKSELARAEEFARASSNEWALDGPRRTTISIWEATAWEQK